MYILAVFINVSSKWRSCRNFMRFGHKSEIIILSMYLINKNSVVSYCVMKQKIAFSSSMQCRTCCNDQGTPFILQQYKQQNIIDKYLFKFIMSITNIACLLLQIYHLTPISVTTRLVLEIKYLCLYLSCFTYTFQHIFHTAY